MQRKRLIATFAVLLAGSALIAFTVGRDDHDALIRDAFANFASAQSVSGELRVETIAVTSLDQAGEVPLRLPVALHGSVRARVPASGMITAEADMAAGLADGKPADSDIRVRWTVTDDGSSFARFENLPDLTLLGINVRSFNGTWLALTQPVEESMRGETRFVSGPGLGTSVLGAIDPLRAMLSSGILVSSAEQMVSEVIDGAPTRHYRLHMRRSDLEEYLMAARSNALGRGLSEPELGKIQALWDGNDIRVEVWIDKDRREIKRMGFDVRPHLDNPSAPVRFMLDIEAYDVTVKTEAPAGAMPLEEYVDGLIGAGAGAQ